MKGALLNHLIKPLASDRDNKPSLHFIVFYYLLVCCGAHSVLSVKVHDVPGLRARFFASSESSVKEEIVPKSISSLGVLYAGVDEITRSTSAMLGSVSIHALIDFKDLERKALEVGGVDGVRVESRAGDCIDSRFSWVAFGDVTTRRGALFLNSNPSFDLGVQPWICEAFSLQHFKALDLCVLKKDVPGEREELSPASLRTTVNVRFCADGGVCILYASPFVGYRYSLVGYCLLIAVGITLQDILRSSIM